jgi:hypothetical protein
MKKPRFAGVRVNARPSHTGGWRRRESNPEAEFSNVVTGSDLQQGPFHQSVNVEYPDGSVCHQLALIDTRLPQLIERWNSLPDFAKQAIFAIATSADSNA